MATIIFELIEHIRNYASAMLLKTKLDSVTRHVYHDMGLPISEAVGLKLKPYRTLRLSRV